MYRIICAGGSIWYMRGGTGLTWRGSSIECTGRGFTWRGSSICTSKTICEEVVVHITLFSYVIYVHVGLSIMRGIERY